MADIVRSILVCVCLGGVRACQHEGSKKRREIKVGEWATGRGIHRIRPLEERILHWMEECRRSGGLASRQSWVLMQSRLLTLLLDLWPPPPLWQEVRPNVERKHSSKPRACGSQSYLYPIMVPRLKEPGNPWGEKGPQERDAILVAPCSQNNFIGRVTLKMIKLRIRHYKQLLK